MDIEVKREHELCHAMSTRVLLAYSHFENITRRLPLYVSLL